MMNLTINRDDYTEYAEFMLQLKRALSYKGNLFAKQAVHSLDIKNMYKTLLPDHLYYRLFDDIGESLEPLVSTYIIRVEEINGKGAYYIKHGSYRKNENIVEFKIYPPTGLYLYKVEFNDEEITKCSNNEFSFEMPENDVLIRITYSEIMPLTTIIYFGKSLSNNIASIGNVTNANSLVINLEGEKTFEVPFENVGTPAYIWFATNLAVTEQLQANLGSPFLVSGTFDETDLITPEGYKIFIHKWPTEIVKIKFYYE